MRFIAKVLKDTLNEKFPDATEDELLKVCAQSSHKSQLTTWLFKIYLFVLIVTHVFFTFLGGHISLLNSSFWFGSVFLLYTQTWI